MRNTKKGFTLVELLIVIAIIAILATVSVVGYVSFIDKANRSADQQAVTQINKYLEADEINNSKPANINEVIARLAEGDLNINDYVPLTKDTYFYWVESLNRVIQVDKDNKIIAPDEYVDANVTTEGWKSLSGHAPKDDSWEKDVTTDLTLSNGATLYDFISSYEDGEAKATGVSTLNLSGKIDMMGAVASFGKVTQGLTIAGTGNDTVLIGVRDDDETSISSIESAPGEGLVNRPYYFGMIGQIAAGQTVTIKDIVIDGANISFNNAAINGEPSQFGLIAGSVPAGATLILENVTIKNSSLTGYQKVGALVGQLGGTLICKNVKIENTTVTGFAQTAALVGDLLSSGTFKYDADCKFDVKVSALDPYAIDPNFDARGKAVTGTDGNTYTWCPYAESTSNKTSGVVYSFAEGITQSYFWNKQNANSVEQYKVSEKLTYYYYDTGAKTADGLKIYLASTSEGGVVVPSNGTATEVTIPE